MAGNHDITQLDTVLDRRKPLVVYRGTPANTVMWLLAHDRHPEITWWVVRPHSRSLDRPIDVEVYLELAAKDSFRQDFEAVRLVLEKQYSKINGSPASLDILAHEIVTALDGEE